MAVPRPGRRRPASGASNGAARAEPDPLQRHLGDRRTRAAQTTPEPPAPPTRTRFPRGAVVNVYVLGALAFVFGAYAAYVQGFIPGVFRASDIGLPIAMVLTLRAAARIVRQGVLDRPLAVAAAGLPRAATWAFGVFWMFWTWTNVVQVAIGLAIGILAFQAYVTHERIQRAGYLRTGAERFGPGLAAIGPVAAAYGLYLVARALVGPVPGFDVFGIVLAFATAGFVIARMRRRVQHLNRWVPDTQMVGRRSARRVAERRLAVGIVVGYLVFRVFISGVIPYAPIVEWWLICIGVLFFAILAADRIGTVATARALPGPDVRTHVQRVESLPDARLAETEAHLAAFVQRGQDADWVHGHFLRLYDQAGVPSEAAAAVLAPFGTPAQRRSRTPTVRTMGLESRRRLVEDMVGLLRRQRGATDVPTTTLKTGGRVRTEEAAAATPR